jgi:hypothetical protein
VLPSQIRRSGQLSDRSIKSGALAPSAARSERELDEPASRYFTWRQLFHAGETFAALQQAGAAPANVPEHPASWNAFSALAQLLLDPLFERFGPLQITYGFAGPALTRHIRGRIAPALDQHAASEERRERFICPRAGAAVDFRVPTISSAVVMDWIERSLPFDRLYFYGTDRPLHLSYHPLGKRGVVEMRAGPSGRLIPKVKR